MNKKSKVKYWHIQCWNSSNLVFEKMVLSGQITEKSMKSLLKCLVAKLSLSESEIISSYAKKRTKIHCDHLEVFHSNGKLYSLTCGSNPYATATLVERNKQ